MFIEVVCIRCTFSTLVWRCFEFSLEHIAWYLFDTLEDRKGVYTPIGTREESYTGRNQRVE